MKRVTLTIAIVLMALTPAAAQVRDFGEMETTSIAAKEAGIGGLRLEREGPEDNRAEWQIGVDVFDLAGAPSGALEIRYPEEDTVDVTFVHVDSSETYRLRVDEAARTFRIEHVGVETVTFKPLCDPTQLTVKGKQYSPEELKELRQQQRECSSQIEVTGTSKSWQEALAEYQGTIDFLAAVNSEVRGFFGIPTRGQREAKERLKRLKQEQESVAQTPKLQSQPQNIGGGICDPDEEQYCPFGDNNFAVLGEGSCFFCNKSDCCTEASDLASVDCYSSTLLDCCANSFCKVTSASNCGLWCSCQLIGYFWGCRCD